MQRRGRRRSSYRYHCSGCGKWVSVDATDEQSFPNVPEAHGVSGTSTYLKKDENGDWQPSAQWVKTKPDNLQIAEELLRIAAELPDIVPERPKSHSAIKNTPDNRLSVYPVADLHLGMLAWHKETGADYDSKIASDRLLRMIKSLANSGEKTKGALLVVLGDFFHADNSKGVTTRGNNPLDVDTRWANVVQTGLSCAIGVIDELLESHETVDVEWLAGNHDDHTSMLLSAAVSAWYRTEERVRVSQEQSMFRYYKFGKNLIGMTHGHTVKSSNDLESIMAHDRSEDWGATRHRYWYTGHIHHVTRHERRGCTVETFGSLAGLDAWSASMGYRHAVAATKIILDQNHGEVFRSTCDLGLIEDE